MLKKAQNLHHLRKMGPPVTKGFEIYVYPQGQVPCHSPVNPIHVEWISLTTNIIGKEIPWV